MTELAYEKAKEKLAITVGRISKDREDLLKLAKFIKRGFDSGNIKSQPFLDFSDPDAASLELKSVYQEVVDAIEKAEGQS